MVKISKEAALEYHEAGRPGKIEVKPTKAYRTQTDLSLAYSPGVAYPCLEIQQNPDDAYKYTDKEKIMMTRMICIEFITSRVYGASTC